MLASYCPVPFWAGFSGQFTSEAQDKLQIATFLDPSQIPFPRGVWYLRRTIENHLQLFLSHWSSDLGDVMRSIRMWRIKLANSMHDLNALYFRL